MGQLASLAFGACLRAHAYVDGDAELRRSIISKKDPSEKWKDALETSRRKDARRAATCARTAWVLLHMMLIAICATYGAELRTAHREGWFGYLFLLFGLLGVNASLYVATSVMDPGFQEVRDARSVGSQGQLGGSYGAAAAVEYTESRGVDWLAVAPGSIAHTGGEAGVAAAVGDPSPPPGGADVTPEAAAPPAYDKAANDPPAARPVSSSGGGNGSGSSSRPRFRASSSVGPAEGSPTPAAGAAVTISITTPRGTDGGAGRTCPVCQAWQPLRTKHCHDCDRCVRRFDHHCVWVGNCVGARNYRMFVAYLVTQLSCLAWGLRILLSGFRPMRAYYSRAMRLPGHHHGSPIDMWVTDHLPLLGGCALFLLLLLFVGSLLAFHAYLVATNQTNYEMLRMTTAGGVHYLRDVPEGIAPFSKGCAANCADFLCQGRDTWGEAPVMPPLEEMRFAAAQGSIWNNKYYSCFD
mmetsp:Transcript_16759/g.42423  ORF Transcript_16759/g.42423 Transcript_16759/m.42423 type:complete len:467 (-) Transcript_16759:56-1456(-)|eukprot:jgi/Tetstr1/433012/TSEL_022349.t1